MALVGAASLICMASGARGAAVSAWHAPALRRAGVAWGAPSSAARRPWASSTPPSVPPPPHGYPAPAPRTPSLRAVAPPRFSAATAPRAPARPARWIALVLWTSLVAGLWRMWRGRAPRPRALRWVAMAAAGAEDEAAPDFFQQNYEALNGPQREGVDALDGPVLVLAGAGTGKTNVLTTRLANVIRTGRAQPGQILAVTFTNKAADEMQERIQRLLGHPVTDMWIGTFHAMAARILRVHHAAVGLGTADFTIVDEADKKRLLRDVIGDLGGDAKALVGQVVRKINAWKLKGWWPGDVPAADGGFALRVFEEYQRRLRACDAADFDDLLLLNLWLFAAHPDVLDKYQRIFRYILVDEYQDTNHVQHQWLLLLARQHGNLCCVGDDDQSIYRFRGADVRNILNMRQDFPAAKVVRLEQNYRSTGHIIGAATGLIAHNASRLGKQLWTDRAAGSPVLIKKLRDRRREAEFVAKQIRRESNPYEYRDTAVLMRTNGQIQEFEAAFVQHQIPYVVASAIGLFDRKEIRDAVAYLRVIAQPRDGLAFQRIVNVPKRGLGPKTVDKIREAAQDGAVEFPEAAQRLLDDGALRGKTGEALATFLADLQRWRALAAEVPPAELWRTVAAESGFQAMVEQQKELEAPGLLKEADVPEDYLGQLDALLREFDTLAEFLEHAALVKEGTKDSDANVVQLMTIHRAKGLEYKLVFLAGWDDTVLPSIMSFKEAGAEGVEEERRLAYVALTRARDVAVITHVAEQAQWGRAGAAYPSPFLAELPRKHVKRMKPKQNSK